MCGGKIYEGGCGATKYIRWFSTMSQREKNEHGEKFNVDNKLTKVMGTIPFLPVFSYRIHILCTHTHTHIHAIVCVPYKNGHKLWKTIILNEKKWKRMKNKKKKRAHSHTPKSSSIVKREVKRQFFIFHSFAAVFSCCSCHCCCCCCWCCYSSLAKLSSNQTYFYGMYNVHGEHVTSFAVSLLFVCFIQLRK